MEACLSGRVLVLDGIEKAERNVLPVLNNLLENREMQLDDGRLIVDHLRYDRLKEVGGENIIGLISFRGVGRGIHSPSMSAPPPYD